MYRQYRYAQRLQWVISSIVVVAFRYFKYVSLQVPFGELDATLIWPIQLMLIVIFTSVGF